MEPRSQTRPSVIIEGPDGAGKTYAAKKFMEYDSFQYNHEGVPPEGVDDLLAYYEIVWERASKPALFDRFFAGELVYGPVMRGSSKFTASDAYLFLRKKIKFRAIHVLLLPQISFCLLSWNKRNFEGREYVREYDKFRQVYEGYESYAKWEGGILWDLVVLEPYSDWPMELMEGSLLEDIQSGGDTLWITRTGSRQRTLALS